MISTPEVSVINLTNLMDSSISWYSSISTLARHFDIGSLKISPECRWTLTHIGHWGRGLGSKGSPL